MRHDQVSTERCEAGDLAALNAVAEAIAGSLRLRAVLDALGRVLADRLGISGGAAYLRSGPNGRLTARANWGVPAGVLAAVGARLQAGWDDPAGTDDEPRPADIVKGGIGPFLTLSVEHADQPWQCCVCIPFWGGAGSPGVLVLFGLAPAGDEAARTVALELLGRLVGAAVRNARLHARVRADRRRLADVSRRLIGAQEEERRRIARELHEEIAQTLAAAQINEMLAVDGSGGLDVECPRAKNIGVLSRTIEQIRDLTHDLRPMTLDRSDAEAIAESYLADGGSVEGLYADVFMPAMDHSGRQWQLGRITVAHEHYISEVTRDLVGRYGPRMYAGVPVRGPVAVLGCVPGERHSIGLMMIGDVFRAGGLVVHALGEGAPSEAIAEFVAEVGADLIGLSCALDIRLPDLADLIPLVRHARPGIGVAVGGLAIRCGGESLGRRLGADYHAADVREASDRIPGWITSLARSRDGSPKFPH